MPKKSKYKFDIIKRRNLHDARQTTLAVKKQSGKAFDLDDVRAFLTQFDEDAAKSKREIKTVVRLPTVHGIRTLKGIVGEAKYDEFVDYLDGKVKETSKFEAMEYIELTVIKSLGVEDYFT